VASHRTPKDSQARGPGRGCPRGAWQPRQRQFRDRNQL